MTKRFWAVFIGVWVLYIWGGAWIFWFPLMYAVFYAVLYGIGALRNKRDPRKTAVSALEGVVILTAAALLGLFT